MRHVEPGRRASWFGLVLVLVLSIVGLSGQAMAQFPFRASAWRDDYEAGWKELYQGDLASAEKHLVAAYEAARPLPGVDLRRVTGESSLAWLRVLQGRHAEAEPRALAALSAREKVQGPEHLDVAFDLNTLATSYASRGLHAEADSLYQRALDIRVKALGPEHPGVADVLNNMANHYKAGGKLARAEPLYRRALTIAEKVAGRRPDDRERPI